jgi:threonine/homoserine/homoserine lactone efflux protein
MTLEMWTAFAFTAMILLATPGPTILLVVSQAVTHGRRSVTPLVAGVMLGDFTQ